MKLASALKLRVNLLKQLSELSNTIHKGLVVQEGMNQTDPNDSYIKYTTKLGQLEQLIVDINYTNVFTLVSFKGCEISIAELLLLKDEAKQKENTIQSILQNSEEEKIADVNDIRMVSVVDRDKYQKKLDAAKDEMLAIELALEEANWEVSLKKL
ncbi:hypothetical protein CANMA_005422 [Candida margitis]|uniref:uncharacterized protein n=1 Tax=Candida margitis TaxID=1775924 RepID=UPI002226F8AF|nr:uncharacterized protein CANMA_005422 [Candida margitis]KAI5949842.1 hypothetical protein CANMA_005422 [Candida margitis]